MKTKTGNFVKNKINEKLNSQHENQYETRVDKATIRNLEIEKSNF